MDRPGIGLAPSLLQCKIAEDTDACPDVVRGIMGSDQLLAKEVVDAF